MSEREANRAAMPIITAIIDELRAAGFPPRVIHAKEGGCELGTVPVLDPDKTFTIPPRYRMNSKGTT